MTIMNRKKLFNIGILGGMMLSSGVMAMDYQALAKQVEHDFAQTMAERDFKKFSSFIDDNAIFISKNTARGKAAVLEQWSRFFETKEAPFSWEQEWVEINEVEKLAFSHGNVYAPDGKIIGKFSSIWKLKENGEWRIVFDKGEPVYSDEAITEK